MADRHTPKKEPEAASRVRQGVSRMTYDRLGSPTSRVLDLGQGQRQVKEDLERDPETSSVKSRKSKSIKTTSSRKSVDLMIREEIADSKRKVFEKRRIKTEHQQKMMESQLELDRAKRELQRNLRPPSGDEFPSVDQVKRNEDLQLFINELELKMKQQVNVLQDMEFEIEMMQDSHAARLRAIEEGSNDSFHDFDEDDENDDPPSQTQPSSVQSWLDHQPKYADPPPMDHAPVASSSSVQTDNLAEMFSKVLEKQQQAIVKSTSGDKSLCQFSGKVGEWMTFKSEFYRTTTEFNLSNSQNLLRLRKALSGSAKESVEHLLPYVDNVETIMSTLEEIYGQPRFIIDDLIRKVKDCPAPNMAKPETIVTFNIRVKALVSTVEALGKPEYLLSIELRESLIKKLPPDMSQSWFRWVISSKVDESINELAKWIDMEAKVAVRRMDSAPISAEDPKKEESKKKQHPKRGPGGVNAAAVEESTEVEGQCHACSESHSLDKCKEFADMRLKEKWDLIRSADPAVCIMCLKQDGHLSRKCPEKKVCGIGGCELIHHRLLHNFWKDKKGKQAGSANEKAESKQEEAGPSGSVNVVMVDGEVVIEGCVGPLPIVPTYVKRPEGREWAYVLKDSGASGTLMTRRFAKKAGIKGRKCLYKYTGVNGETVVEPDAEIVDCEISGVFRNAPILPLRDVIIVNSIKMRPYSCNFDKIKEKWPHLHRMRARNLKDVVPDIIIGGNNANLILARELLTGPPDAPIGWRTPLGWTVGGRFNEDVEKKVGSVNVMAGNYINDAYLHDLIKGSFSLENFGVVVPKTRGINRMEQRAYKVLQETTRKVDGRWETGLLWREENSTLPDSYNMAFSRLKSVEKKFVDPEIATKYKAKIKEYLDKGYIRKLSSEEISAGNERTWYIPHFPVTNPNKPGKFRLVLDAAAESNGTSLNKNLSKGPDLIRPLPAVIWNFRRHRYVLAGDIADMFHRVKVIKVDWCSQRILFRDSDMTRNPDVYEMVVLIFGATSSPCSAIYCKNQNALQYQDSKPETVEVILDDFYFDDCLTGAYSIPRCIELRQELTEIHDAGNFNLCKFSSNSKEVLESIPVELRAEGVKSLNEKSTIPGERVLGLWWDPEEDTFGFRLGLHKVPQKILDGEVPTKRQACGLVMSVYDPLGLVSHFKIKGIMLLQRTWIAETDWDQELPEDIFKDWLIWLHKLSEIVKVKVPRCYEPNIKIDTTFELHVFVDASQEAYAAVSYLRIIHGSGEFGVAFMGSKARVAPVKLGERKRTIPQLELQAAVLGTRYAKTVLLELKIKRLNRTVFWSDSSTVLAWIRADDLRHKEFEANRVGEIQEATAYDQWKWVPTDENPADLATRFEKEISFAPDDFWFKGPGFLKKSEDEWPAEPTANLIAVMQMEKFGDTPRAQSRPGKLLTPLIRFQDFSSFPRMTIRTAAVLKAARHWKNKWEQKKFKLSEELIPPWKMDAKTKTVRTCSFLITPEQYQEAVIILVRWAQAEEFGRDILRLKAKKAVKSDKLARLSPCLEDEILCLKSRVQNAEKLPVSQKTPAILPSHHRLTELLILEEHERCAHQGQETVLNNLRKRFWIVDGRQTVLRVVRDCRACRLKRVAPIMPQMGQLPDYRLAAYQPPFSFTGLDFFGPITVTVGRRHEKRWGAIFTCLVTRGVHLEIAHGLSTDEAMMALSRYIDTRGRPNTIYSDNGTNFRGASKEMKEAAKEIDFEAIATCGKFGPIDWRFNPPAAPHFGGAWERLIKSVKKCMYAVLHETYPKDTTLLTVIKSIENIVNSRPLTYVSSDPTEEDALTPNHFLRGWNDAGPAIPCEVTEDDLRKQWKRVQILADQFWIKWTRDYIPKLMARSKWHSQTEPVRVGDLVLIVDEQYPRNMWKRGVVSKVWLADDGQVRVVDVTTIKDGKKEKLYQRAVSKICPLGLRMDVGELKEGIHVEHLHESGAGMSKISTG